MIRIRLKNIRFSLIAAIVAAFSLANAQSAGARISCKGGISTVVERNNLIDSYRINVGLKDAVVLPENGKLYLYAFQFGEKVLVDSTRIKNGRAVFKKKLKSGNNSQTGNFLQTGFFTIEGIESPPLLFGKSSDIALSCKGGNFKVDKSDENKILWTLCNYPQKDLLFEINGNFLARYFSFYNDLSSFSRSSAKTVTEFERILKNFDFSDPRFCNSMHFDDMKSALGWYLSSDNFSSDEIAEIVDEILGCAAAGGKAQVHNYCRVLYDILLSSGDPQLEGAMLRIYDMYDRGWIPEGRQRSVKRQMERARRLSPGAVVPELRAFDAEGKEHSTNDIRSKYTILWFWDPDCDHCQEETPVLHDFYSEKAEDLDFEVFAVEVNDDHERWRAFSEQHRLDDWVNLSTSMGEPNVDFIDYFDIVTTPVVVLVDNSKGGAIMARQISLSEIKDIIEKQK